MKHDYRAVEPYLRQKRTAQQEQELEQDVHLKKEVAFYSDLSKVVNWTASMNEAQAEMSMNASQAVPARVRRLGIRSVLSYAASFLVLLTASAFWYANTNYSNAALMTKSEAKFNIAEYNNRNATVQTQEKDVLQIAVTAIKKEQCQAAIKGLDSVTKAAPTYYSAQLLKAYAAAQLAEHEEVILYAKVVVEKSPHKLEQQKAEWLIVQSELAKEEIPSALIQKIANDPSHLFQKEARQLENKLNNFWRNFLL